MNTGRVRGEKPVFSYQSLSLTQPSVGVRSTMTWLSIKSLYSAFSASRRHCAPASWIKTPHIKVSAEHSVQFLRSKIEVKDGKTSELADLNGGSQTVSPSGGGGSEGRRGSNAIALLRIGSFSSCLTGVCCVQSHFTQDSVRHPILWNASLGTFLRNLMSFVDRPPSLHSRNKNLKFDTKLVSWHLARLSPANLARRRE